MVYFQRLVRPVVVPLFIGLILTPPFVLAENKCQPSVITDSEILVRLALVCNAGQRAIKNRLQAQQFRAKSVGQWDDPKLMVAVAPNTFGDDRLDNGYILELSQPIPSPDVLSLRKEAANAHSDAWEARQYHDQVRLVGAVRMNYAQWQYHRTLLSINERHQALWQEFIAIVQAKYASITISKSALLQASHEHHLLLQQSIELQAAIERDSSELRRLVNLPKKTKFDIKIGLPLTDLPPDKFSALLARLDQQPVMQELDAQRREKDSEIALTEKDRYPSFSAIARYNSLWANEEQRMVVGVNLNLPFDFGKRTSREQSLRAEQRALRWEHQDLGVQLREQLIQEQSFWQQTIDVHRLYLQDLLPLAKESLNTARDEYQFGAGDFLSLLVAERQLLAAERKVQLALRDQYIQFAKLMVAAGLVQMNGWNSIENTEPTSDSDQHEGSEHE